MRLKGRLRCSVGAAADHPCRVGRNTARDIHDAAPASITQPSKNRGAHNDRDDEVQAHSLLDIDWTQMCGRAQWRDDTGVVDHGVDRPELLFDIVQLSFHSRRDRPPGLCEVGQVAYKSGGLAIDQLDLEDGQFQLVFRRATTPTSTPLAAKLSAIARPDTPSCPVTNVSSRRATSAKTAA
jgi:hypothetical protein